MEVLSLLKFLSSIEEKNGVVCVSEIESVLLSENSEHALYYDSCIIFTMKSGSKISWNYKEKENMYSEFQELKQSLQKTIITP